MSDFLAVCEQAARAGGASPTGLGRPYHRPRERAEGLGDGGRFCLAAGDSRGCAVRFSRPSFLGEERMMPRAKLQSHGSRGDGGLSLDRGSPGWHAELHSGLAVVCGLCGLGARRASCWLASFLIPCWTNALPAAAGCGAFLNGKRIRASRCKSLCRGVGRREFLGQCASRLGRNPAFYRSSCTPVSRSAARVRPP